MQISEQKHLAPRIYRLQVKFRANTDMRGKPAASQRQTSNDNSSTQGLKPVQTRYFSADSLRDALGLTSLESAKRLLVSVSSSFSSDPLREGKKDGEREKR